MVKSKKFVFKKGFGQDMNDLLASADENLGVYSSIKQETIPLSHIIIRDNPRHLSITTEDIKSGLSKSDPLYEKKFQEYDALKGLVESIKEQGVLHDIHVFEEDENFVLVMGQRRVLASLLADKKTINAKIWKEKPNDQVLKAYQWVENFNREDLPLWDAIDSAKEMLKIHIQNKRIGKLTVRDAAKVLYCGKTQANYFCSLLEIKPDVKKGIKNGKIASLRLAAKLNNIEDDNVRIKVLSESDALKISDLGRIQSEIDKKSKSKNETRGKQPTRVTLGHTTNKKVALHIINTLINTQDLEVYRSEFAGLDKDYKSLTTAFRKILTYLERQIGE